MCFHCPKACQKAFSLVERAEQRTCPKPNHRNVTAQGRLQYPLFDAGVFYVKKRFLTYMLMRAKAK